MERTAYQQVWEKTRRLGQVGWHSLLNTFLAKSCAVCDRSATHVFCLDCSRQIEAEYYASAMCHLSRFDSRSGYCQKNLALDSALSVGALGAYQGRLKQAILSLKYSDCPEVAQALGAELAKRWKSQLSQWPCPLYVVPIPLHPNRLAQRGYNQAALIARAFTQVSGLALAEHALRRCQDTTPQHQLGAEARRENLMSAFEVSAAGERQLLQSQSCPNVLLIDDIYTTGATAQSAAARLRALGVGVLGILVLARAVSDEHSAESSVA